MMVLTDACQVAREAIAQRRDGKWLRVFVQGGGCSGFEYGLAFDEPRDGDEVIEMEGFSILVDKWSVPYLEGVTVDFVEDPMGSGFKFANPKAKGSCGCGHSFSA